MKKLSIETMDIIGKVRALAAYRGEAMSKKQKLISFESACRRTGILSRTVTRHAPELVQKWGDEDFHWDPSKLTVPAGKP